MLLVHIMLPCVVHVASLFDISIHAFTLSVFLDTFYTLKSIHTTLISVSTLLPVGHRRQSPDHRDRHRAAVAFGCDRGRHRARDYPDCRRRVRRHLE